MTTLLLVLTMTAGVAAQQQPCAAETPAAAHGAHSAHDQHAAMNARGSEAMGFDQSRATHHFILLATGGSIEVTANDPADATVEQQVVSHLRHITGAFKSGNFAIPVATHGELPTGAAEMAAAKDHITYTFEDIPDGGRVRITGHTPAAIDAIHTFLRYQIAEHCTGDPTTPR